MVKPLTKSVKVREWNALVRGNQRNEKDLAVLAMEVAELQHRVQVLYQTMVLPAGKALGGK